MQIVQRLSALEAKVTIMMAAYGVTIAGFIGIGIKKLFNGKNENGK